MVKCIFCSDPDVSKNVGNAPPRKQKESKIFADIKENVECISSVATSAQVKEFFGSAIDPDRFPRCCAAGSNIMVILTKKIDVALEDITDNDWTTGTYQDILLKYNASKIKDFPTAHAVDLLSIATQNNPIPLKDVPLNLTEALPGIYYGEQWLVKTLQDDTFKFKIEGKRTFAPRVG